MTVTYESFRVDNDEVQRNFDAIVEEFKSQDAAKLTVDGDTMSELFTPSDWRVYRLDSSGGAFPVSLPAPELDGVQIGFHMLNSNNVEFLPPPDGTINGGVGFIKSTLGPIVFLWDSPNQDWVQIVG